MEAQDKFSWLDDYLFALEKALGFMDLSTLQPMSWRHFQPLIAKEWLVWFERILVARKEKNISFEELAKVIPPEISREHLLFTMDDIKTAKWPKEKRLEISDFFYSLMKEHLQPNDLFGLNHSTPRHSKEEVNKILEKDFQEGTPEIARELGKLYNGGYNLGAALFLDFYMGKPVSNYGAYNLEGNKSLVIKNLKYMNPKELWPKRTTIANNLHLHVIYENVKFSTDLIACHSQYDGDPINGLRKWRLERDGEAVTDVTEIKEIAYSLAKNGSDQWKELLALPEPELLEKSIWIRCFVFKEACELSGLDWHPSPELLNSVKGKTLEQGWNRWKHPKEEKEYLDYWRKVYDPRIDFYG
jgi:hypothetical protein